MKKSYHLIANWKMNLNVQEAVALSQKFSSFIAHNPSLLSHLTCIICPSFELLSLVFEAIKTSPILLGAQGCSANSKGNFTGEVSAYNLRQIGCSYCIIGHSERRLYHHETDAQITAMCKKLFEQTIIPIYCIGESQKDQEENKSLFVLESQLEPLFRALSEATQPVSQCIIAYEPVWSIGTQALPSSEHLATIFEFIKKKIENFKPGIEWTLVYGGGVSESSLPELLKIDLIEGFLIGRASTHLQQLESMIQHIRKLICS